MRSAYIFLIFSLLPCVSSQAHAQSDLTGEWRSDSGGIYDITQNGNQVVWEAHSPDGTTWTHRFSGVLDGDTLQGSFYDHPPGHYHNSGALVFQVEGNRIVRVNQSRAFSDLTLIRENDASNIAGGADQHSPQSDTGALYAANPPTPKTQLDEQLDQIVAFDANSWGVNRFDQGSVHGSRVLSQSKGGRMMVVYGEYTFNHGKPGWVRAEIDDGKPKCLAFWDDQNCRPVGESLSKRASESFVAATAYAAAHPAPAGSPNGTSVSSPPPNPYAITQDPRFDPAGH